MIAWNHMVRFYNTLGATLVFIMSALGSLCISAISYHCKAVPLIAI